MSLIRHLPRGNPFKSHRECGVATSLSTLSMRLVGFRNPFGLLCSPQSPYASTPDHGEVTSRAPVPLPPSSSMSQDSQASLTAPTPSHGRMTTIRFERRMTTIRFECRMTTVRIELACPISPSGRHVLKRHFLRPARRHKNPRRHRQPWHLPTAV